MKKGMKKIVSFLIVFLMAFANINTGLLGINKIFAEENTQETVTVNDAISVIADYFNKDYYKQNGGRLEGAQYAAMFKAGADLTKKNWKLNEKIPKTGSYDPINSLGGKAEQSLVLLDLGKDPSDFSGRNLIKEMGEELDKTTSSRFIINEIKAMQAIDKFNEKYKDKKVQYNAENLIKLVIKTQKENGCIDGAVGNTAYAIDLFSKNEHVNGVKEAKKKAIDYLKNTIKEDGTIYEKYYFTKIQGEIVKELAKSGEDLTADCWSKDGKSIIDGIFKSWDGDGFQKRRGGYENYTAYTEILSTLGDLKNLGYGDYVLKGVKFNNLVKEEKPTKPEEPKETASEIKIRVEGIKETLYNKNASIKNEITVSELLKSSIGEENIKGLSGGFVTSILGESGTSSTGWMYYLVDKEGNPKEADIITKQSIKDNAGNYYKEMVWYMAKWNGGITCIPNVKVEHKGNNYSINIKEQNVMMSIDPRPAKDVNVKVEGVGEYKTDENGNVNFKVTKGEHKVHIYKNIKDSEGEYPAIVRQSFTIVGEENETDNKIEKVIEDLKKYYDDKELNYLNVLSFNSLNKGEKLQFKLGKTNNAAACADNIMGIIAIGKNPYSYEGVNCVKQLTESQKENGKFSIGKNDEKSPTALAESIIALDMASAKYNEEKAIKALMAFSENGKYEDIDTTTKALIALSKHINKDGVKGLIESCVKDLKEKQLEGGGFDYYGFGNSPYSTAPVIQALIALGEDPTSEKWSKGGRNPFDALCSCKVSGIGFEMAEGMGAGCDDITATNFAFAALVDMYKQKSMYESFKFNVEAPKDYNKIINSEIEDIKSFYKNVSSYDYSIALGLKAAAVNTEDINKNIVLKNKEDILFCAQDIMSIIAMGKNPRNYNGKNYVQTLVENIKNPKEKHVLTKGYMYGLIALNMASANKEDIELAISKVKSELSGGNFGKVAETALGITALSPYKEKPEIKNIIDSCIDYLKGQQLENAAFTLSKSMFKNGDSEDTALVIEAIVAAGGNPLSKEWCKGDKTPLDALMTFKMGKGYIYESMFGAYEQAMYTSNALRAFTAVKEKSIVFNKFKMNYDPEKDKTPLIIETLKDLKNYYSSKKEYGFRQALSFNFSSDNLAEDIKIIQEKFKAKEVCKSVSDYAANIMGIISSGKDPKNYNSNNYVDKLVKSQVTEGDNKGKLVILESDANWPTIQAYAILALDMADANYDREAAVKALCKMSSNNKYRDIDTTAMAITALAPYKNLPEVKVILDASIKYLKENINAQGGYDAYGQANNPCTIATVIQALVANEIDPLSDQWCKNGSTMLDALLKNKKDGNFGDEFTNSEAFMALADLYKGSSMFRGIKFNDGTGTKAVIDEVKEYLNKKDKTYNYLQALALRNAGITLDAIRQKFQLREQEPQFLNYDTKTTNTAKNIIGMVAAGLDPRDYQGKNYVETLLNSQDDRGVFKLSEDKNQSISAQAYSIIALDMCNEKYDTQVINLLMEEGKKVKDKGVAYVSPIIIALSNHRDVKGVNEAIDNCIQNIKACQAEDGGFAYSRKHLDEKCSEYTSEAIQALIAAGEDILSDAWKKNGKTPLDALLTYKKGDHFIYDSVKSSYDEYTDEANGMAFAALVDIYNGQSMFKVHNEKLNTKDVEIKNITNIKEFKYGKDAKITVEATNTLKKDKKATLLVALYDGENKMINYVAVKQTIKPGEKVELEGMMKLPSSGQGYKIKAFVWDSVEEMNTLSDTILIPVVK